MSNAESTVTVVVVVLVGLAASLLIDPPVVWVVGGLLVVLTCVGTDHVVHTHWRVHLRRKRYSATTWILPGTLVCGAFLFLRLLVSSNRTSPGLAAAFGLTVVGVLLTVVIIGQYRTLDRDDPWYRRARFALNLLAYLTAFGLYSAIYSTKLRSIFSATAIVLVTGLICLELFRGTEASVGRTWRYAGTVAIIIGEITWALNYWTISPLAAGVFLLLSLYLLGGFVQNHLIGQLNRGMVAELSTVTLLGFGLLLASLVRG